MSFKILPTCSWIE